MCTHQAHFGFDLKIQKKRQNGHIEKISFICRLGAHTETTFMVKKFKFFREKPEPTIFLA